MREKIKECFDRLQSLDIKPTLKNMETLLQTLYDLRNVYQQMEGSEQNADNGQTADPE